jgi:uncharacterized protein (TIGR01777 family)
MRIVIAGGSGFLGRPLVELLISRGHDVATLSRGTTGTRHGPGRQVTWNPDGTAEASWAQAIDGADAVVNLAGAGIADKRWTTARKEELRSSRILSTRSLVAAIRSAAQKPPVFIQGSAVGYYGTPNGEPRDESFPPGSDFLATLAVDWEAEARAAEALGCRVVLMRTAVVLARDGGALKKMGLPFQFYVGGPIGSGRQYLSWIHRDDWIAFVEWLIDTPAAAGAFNASAPNPVTNREFSAALGRALGRPSWLTVPGFALRTLVGEAADVALLRGQRAVPRRALELGFTFKYPDVHQALREVYA